MTSKQRVVPGGEQVPEKTYYVYNGLGERVRKVAESHAGPNSQLIPVRLQERIYIGDYEIFRKYTGEATLSLERTTYHASTEYGHLADICTRTAGDDMGRQHQVRFQLQNHLGSATAELDDAGALLSYEEFFPFGSSSYKAVPRQTDVAKRFRFTGKELDVENGLYYYGARCYAAWLGSRYDYVVNNPVRFTDPDGRDPDVSDQEPDPERYKTDEYIRFEKNVGNPEDPGGTRVLIAEEKSMGLVDVLTKEHFEAVKMVVNEAIKTSTKHFRDSTGKLTTTHHEILRYALRDLIIPMREKDEKNNLESTQNLILRKCRSLSRGPHSGGAR